MEFGPVIRAMLRNKSGYVLIALQIAVTMAIMVNAVAIIQERSAMMARPSGVDEDNMFYLLSLIFQPDTDEKALVRDDLEMLRNVPGVVDAISTNSVPLRGGGWSMGLQVEPGAEHDGSGVAIYFVDEHGIDTFGVDLIAGRNFLPGDVTWNDPEVSQWPPMGIISKAMAETLFPDDAPADVVGRTVYINDDNPVQVIGILDRLQAPWSGWSGVERSMLVPEQREWGFARYVIRTEPGMRDQLMFAPGQTQQLVTVGDVSKPSGGHVLLHDLVGRLETEPDQFTWMLLRLLHQQVVIGIEDQAAAGSDRVADDPLDIEQLVEALRTEVAQMIFGNVGNQCGIRVVDAEATAQESATRSLQDCRFHAGLAQHHPCTARTGPVVAIDDLVIDRYPVGAA